MSSKLSGPQRRKLLASGRDFSAEIARSDAIAAGTRPNDKAANLVSQREYSDPARQALLVAARIVHRDNWRAQLLLDNGRPINVKSGGWQRMESEMT